MPLGAHLRELRTRLVRSSIGVALGGVVGWLAYNPIFDFLRQPLDDAKEEAERRGAIVTINFPGVTDAFSLKIQVAIVVGILVSSPIWLYQLWAFITPGLRRNERKYALGFLAAAVPFFLAGAALAMFVLPKAVSFLFDFTPEGGSNIVDATKYLGFVMRMTLAFGAAFLVPVVIVGLNFAGILPAERIRNNWRVSVFIMFVFSAAATPTPDAWTMLILAGFMIGLCSIAYVIAWLHDRRKARRDPYRTLADDETSSLEEQQL